MLWRLVRKLARIYALVAIGVLGFVLLSDQIASHQLRNDEALRALFFPYGVLTGLVISWILMKWGAWLTVLSVAGFYLVSYWQTGTWPQSDLPLIIAGAAPLFLLAGFLQSIGRTGKRKRADK